MREALLGESGPFWPSSTRPLLTDCAKPAAGAVKCRNDLLMLWGARGDIDQESGAAVCDHFLPFRSGHGYDRYRQERPVIGSRPRGSIARSEVIRCTLPRRDTGCCGTPFGSPIFPSLRDIFGKEQTGTDFGKTAPYRHRKGRSARFVPFDLRLREGLLSK